jgi:RNA binding exosome subunit
LVEIPLRGCDREQGGSAPNAVKRFKRKVSLAETSGYFGEPLIFAELQFARGRQLLTFLNLEPNFRITEWVTRNRLSKLQIFIDGLRKAGLPE